MIKNAKARSVLTLFPITLGCALYALGFNLFLSPYNIVNGGLTGIGLIVNRIFGAPSVGVFVLICNVPLLIAAYVRLGRKSVFYTIYGAILTAVLLDVFAFIPGVETEPLLAALFGGVVEGAGLGIVFLFGGTTGGVDIVASLIRARHPNFKMGRIILVMDACVATIAAIVFHSIASGMYAVVVFYVSSVVCDAVLYGNENARIAYIISDKNDEIAKTIEERVQRGVTFLQGQGAYTGNEKKIILCAVKRRQVVQVKRIVKELDPEAFFIISSANEVLGNGFTPNL